MTERNPPPRILGNSMANQMLLFNRKLTAEEAAAHGFVSEVDFVQKILPFQIDM